MELINLELKFPTKMLIHKLIYHLIQKYFFHYNPNLEYKLLGVDIPIRCSEYLLIVKSNS